MQLSPDQLQMLKSYFSDKPVLKAYVFGSYARGDADEKSDIDLLLQLDYSKKIGLQYVRMQLELEDIMHKRVEFSTVDFLKPGVQKLVDRDKKLIYEKS